MGGSNTKSNLVLLTAKEHFIAHKLLVRIHPSSHGLWVALLAMSGRMAGFTARIFASERERATVSRKDFKYTDESRLKMSAAAKARGRNSPKTEFKKGQAVWNAGLPTEMSHRYGKVHNDDTRAKMVSAQQARRDEHSMLMKLWWADRKAATKQEEIRP